MLAVAVECGFLPVIPQLLDVSGTYSVPFDLRSAGELLPVLSGQALYLHGGLARRGQTAFVGFVATGMTGPRCGFLQ
jgi:hypothetical protein